MSHLKILNTFDGELAGLATITVDQSIASCTWNNHLPVPLAADEVVYVHPDQTNISNSEKYVRVIHGGGFVSVFSHVTLDGMKPEPVRVIESMPAEESISSTSELALVSKIKPTAPVKEKKSGAAAQFLGKDHTKSGVVLAVVKAYVDNNPGITLAQLKTAFPDTLLRRFGIVQEISKSVEIAKGGARYFTKESQQIKLADCIAVVCNQITAENIKPFLAEANKLGYEVVMS